MKIELQRKIEEATGFALATTGVDGLNVVPVSMARATEKEIWIFDFFMNKTTRNVEETGDVSLAIWKDLSGVQFKGRARYVTEGDVFDMGVAWVQKKNPNCVVCGVIVITPEKAYDITAGNTGAVVDL